ncbi:polysaccharide lyase [Nemania sp. FL0916]|nr:polysaccharide lyase [Nemania sp. FL0916]
MLSHALTRALCALSVGGAAVQASQSFSNTGVMSGWDSYTHENKGTVQEVTNVVYKGSTALKMTQVYDPNYSGRYHSEAVKNNVYKKGDTGFYGFAFRLQEDWQFSPSGSYNLAQFIADFTDLGCEETYMPSTLIWIEGNQLATRVKYGNVCPTSQQQIRSFTNLATVTAGAWHRVELQVDWQSDSTGYFKMWFDGVKVTETYNIPTNVGDGRAFEFRVGLYANGWHDSGYTGSQPTRQVWYDQIAAGTVFADANPDAW